MRFKSHYIVLGEMLYKTPLNDLKKCLKIVNKDILIFYKSQVVIKIKNKPICILQIGFVNYAYFAFYKFKLS